MAEISIHTPTQGVTSVRQKKFYTIDISIHTPTQGVTVLGFVRLQHSHDFNPHSHAGSDWH